VFRPYFRNHYRNIEAKISVAIYLSLMHVLYGFIRKPIICKILIKFLPRDSYAKRGICRRRVSVCVSVSLSVTLRYCIKTAKRRIMQIMPHDSTVSLVF